MTNLSTQGSKELCPFGIALSKFRQSKGISAGRLAMKSEVYPSHLHKIEKGMAQPSIATATKLISVLGDASDFFKELALSENFLSSDNTYKSNDAIYSSILGISNSKNLDNVKSIFGVLFREFRNATPVTQQKISEITEYSIRDIQKVEAGTQDPNVMTALAMVCAVAQIASLDISIFFNPYQELTKKTSK